MEDDDMAWWQPVLGVGIALAVAWLAIVTLMLIAKPRGNSLGEALRLLPDLLRLLRRLAADRSVPRGVRLRLGLLMAYLASPIDLIPDFVPVLGYADDAIIVTLMLRSTVRSAGLKTVRRHWPGSDDGFAALCRLSGLRDGSSASEPARFHCQNDNDGPGTVCPGP